MVQASSRTLTQTHHELLSVVELLLNVSAQVAVWDPEVLSGFSVVVHQGQEAIGDVDDLDVTSGENTKTIHELHLANNNNLSRSEQQSWSRKIRSLLFLLSPLPGHVSSSIVLQ